MTWQNYVATPKFEEYKEQFKEHLIMERRNGIILMRMHTNGAAARWTWPLHQAMPQAFHVVGNDPENEVMILSGTGSYWIEGTNPEMRERDEKGLVGYDQTMYDACKLVENLLFDLDIPTIAAVNGPARLHSEMAVFCDITICSEDASFVDPHFLHSEVPGDGLGLAFQGAMGFKRAAYYLYTGKTFDAKTALELGVVHEVLPAEKLMDRAWEIAEEIMKQPRVTRRLTSRLIRRPWQRLVMDHFQMQMAYEFYAHEMHSETWGRVSPMRSR